LESKPLWDSIPIAKKVLLKIASFDQRLGKNPESTIPVRLKYATTSDDTDTELVSDIHVLEASF